MHNLGNQCHWIALLQCLKTLAMANLQFLLGLKKGGNLSHGVGNLMDLLVCKDHPNTVNKKVMGEFKKLATNRVKHVTHSDFEQQDAHE